MGGRLLADSDTLVGPGERPVRQDAETSVAADRRVSGWTFKIENLVPVEDRRGDRLSGDVQEASGQVGGDRREPFPAAENWSRRRCGAGIDATDVGRLNVGARVQCSDSGNHPWCVVGRRPGKVFQLWKTSHFNSSRLRTWDWRNES